jgi:hypothetical protein
VVLADKAFLDGAKERIHDLFRTPQGLDGHARQVQQEFNRLNNSNLPPDRMKLLGDAMLEQMTKAAQYAGHNIPETMFTLPNAGRTYVIQKAGGAVKAYSKVYTA